ncbi:MAG: hypothetical protein P9F75_04020 [Candidatus Contendobacter sp.]|nr:hypothetical protein [Candidatus Contendobacter sp.]
MRALLDRYYQQDDHADPLRLIIPKGGYAVQFQAPSATPPTEGFPKAGEVPRMPHGPVLAVAPCRHPSGDDRSAALGEGLTQELIHRLTQCPELYVLALDTMGHYRQRHATARDLRNELAGLERLLPARTGAVPGDRRARPTLGAEPVRHPRQPGPAPGL